MTIKLTSLLALSLTFLAACGGEEAPEASTTTNETEEPTIVRPEPSTVTSGNSFVVVYTMGSAEYQTGYDYNFHYTVLDYTTNCAFADLPIEEYHEPTDEQQLIKVTVEVKVISLRNLNCKEPLDGFHLIYGDVDDQAFTRFSPEFIEKSEPKCLAVDETQTFDVYFKAPLDADLSSAQLSLYRGSDEDPAAVNLNK